MAGQVLLEDGEGRVNGQYATHCEFGGCTLDVSGELLRRSLGSPRERFYDGLDRGGLPEICVR